MFNTLFTPFLFLFVNLQSPSVTDVPNRHVLATHSFSLEKRYSNTFVNDVFKDNILLSLNYLGGNVKDASKIDWKEIEKPYHYEMTLAPNEVFAFHDDVLPEYAGRVTKTANSHFVSYEGYKSDGYLIGDGVCHFASLIYWTAVDAHLEALAPTRHYFAEIPDVPREMGVSIFSLPGQSGNEQQNLYVKNNLKKNVVFVFDYKNNSLVVAILEEL